MNSLRAYFSSFGVCAWDAAQSDSSGRDCLGVLDAAYGPADVISVSDFLTRALHNSNVDMEPFTSTQFPRPTTLARVTEQMQILIDYFKSAEAQLRQLATAQLPTKIY